MTNTHLNYDDMLPVPVETRQQWYDDGIESVSITDSGQEAPGFSRGEE